MAGALCMKTYENNMADQTLIVKDLKVLGKMDGGNLREIKQSVDSIRKQINVANKQQEQYWAQLSDDGIVSVIEKQVLLREMDNIQKSEAAITTQATTYGYTGEYLQSFIETYEELHSYLYDTLKVFDDMSSDTPIGDREHFNELFSNYYWFENFLLLAISAGILDQINFRVLNSLNEPGEEGETGIYKGGLYQYTDGAWKSVTTGAYKGQRTELPGIEEGAFFIVPETFLMTDVLIVNDTELLVNGEELLITRSFEKGIIYYCENGIWFAEEDLTNWRYAAAFADVINITGRLPQIFQDAVDDLQDQIDTKAGIDALAAEIQARQGQYTIINGDIVRIENKADENADDITDIIARANQQQTEIDGKISHLPVYFGGVTVTPTGAQEGDFFTWAGTTYGDRENSKVYLYHNGAWQGLDPLVTANRSYYMMALEDVLATQNITSGAFSYIFAQSFWANEASMNALSTKTIYIRQGGYIQSDNTQYVPHQHGLKIDSDGNIDANQNTHIGGNCTIDGNATIKGTLDGADGSFKGSLNGVDGNFTNLVIKEYIRSEDEVYFPGVGNKPRFKLNKDGSIENYGVAYFGNNVDIAGDCNISGNSHLKGNCIVEAKEFMTNDFDESQYKGVHIGEEVVYGGSLMKAAWLQVRRIIPWGLDKVRVGLVSGEFLSPMAYKKNLFDFHIWITSVRAGFWCFCVGTIDGDKVNAVKYDTNSKTILWIDEDGELHERTYSSMVQDEIEVNVWVFAE
jgi:hypothetical protein